MTIYATEVSGKFAYPVSSVKRDEVFEKLGSYPGNTRFELEKQKFTFIAEIEANGEEQARDTARAIAASCLFDSGYFDQKDVTPLQVTAVAGVERHPGQDH
jgi:hypothetical protein